ncbi:MAG: haloacid dehalogenase type II [Alphaproteobacteria bacterium]|nr:haloacid dehalogenase type II [Alphaproteobacteria bacterium]
MPLIFDVYGTLLDVDAAASKTAEKHPSFAEHWADVSAAWRHRQLSYSWLRSLMGRYTSFWQITMDALDVTLDEMGINEPQLRQHLLDLYYQLPAYDEVAAQLSAMSAKGHALGVLSNGSPDMLAGGLTSAGIYDQLDHVLSVDSLNCYKPDPRVYEMVLKAFDCTAEQVTFFSSNNWDIAGAGSFGFRTIWVNRGGKTWDDLPEPPTHIVSSLAEAVRLID